MNGSLTIGSAYSCLKNDPNSFFRINVDGITGNIAKDVEIAGKDSLYIFAEVTIDPDAPLSNSPFVIEDYLVFAQKLFDKNRLDFEIESIHHSADQIIINTAEIE